MNRILTLEILIEAYKKDLADGIEMLNCYDVLCPSMTKDMLDNGFPKQYVTYKEGEHNLITLQDMIDACNAGVKYKAIKLDGIIVEAWVNLAHIVAKDGRSKVWFYGTWKGIDFVSHSRIDRCLLFTLYGFLLGFMESQSITFKSKEQ